LRRFLRPPVAARWEDVERLGVGRRQIHLDLRGAKRRRVTFSTLLVGLPDFVSEAAHRSQ
jgi:hypothetical protein